MGSNSKKFQKLTPINCAQMNIYEEAIDFVFENEDVKNIAISGAYSAGKSSVIETYKKSHPKKNFLHISLASFESFSSLEEKNTDYEEENVLEGKILNQLIHQIEPKNIPQTNFRVKRTASQKQSIIQTIGILLFCILILYAFKFEDWKAYVETLSKWKTLLLWTAETSTLLIAFMIGTALLGYFLYCVIQIQKNKNILKKISVNGNEIEIFEQSNESYFDKYLNEVLYLFEKSGADIVVFEDMDRYNSNQIFQRLREVNILINNRRIKNNDTPIRFFYLIRDDIFVSKDRTKFFDFIIPIVPVLDGSNSYDQFITHFKNGEILELFEENFLQGISLYVDDMRILKNIYNEFVIYNARIGNTEQNANKLLAMIVYKNLFPHDFSDLQLNKGFVFSMFNSKEKFIEEKKSTLQKRIEEKNERISEMKSEVLKSKEEISALYTTKNYTDYYGRTLEKYIPERELRKKNLELYSNGEEEKIRAEIIKIENQILELENSKLSELIDRENIDSIFKTCHTNEIGEVNQFNEIKSSEYFDLLKFLIRNGFIDESYQDYMTYFYEGSLSRRDKIFLRSVTDQKAKEYTYILDNPQKILSRLRVVDFEHEEILNFDLVAYMIIRSSMYDEQIKRFISQLKDGKKYEFIIRFIQVNRDGETLIKIINRHWPQFFENMLEESNYSQKQKTLIAQLSLYVSGEEEIIKVNERNVLSDYISNQRDFLDIEEQKTEIVMQKLAALQVRFVDLEIPVSNVEAWNNVYTNNLYEINWPMIENILEYCYNIPRNDDYKHKNFTLICSKPKESLFTYVKENIDEYFEEMLAHCGEKILDTEDVVILVLNDMGLDDKYKKKYIDILSSKITSLEDIDNIVWWTKLMDDGVLLYSEENVLQYFLRTGEKYDSILIQFINKFADRFSIDSKKVDEVFGEKFLGRFFSATVKCNEMQNDKYELILSSMNRYYSSFTYENINEDKIEILIKHRIIRMSSEVLLFMREHYPNQVLLLIVKNSNEYVNAAINEDNFVFDELLDVLETEVEEGYKIKLLEYTNEPISIESKNYGEGVEECILKNNFDKKDLCYILQNFEKLVPSSQAVVEILIKEYVEDICSNEYPITYALLEKVLLDKTIDYTKRLELFASSVCQLNNIQCKRCLEVLEFNDYLSLFEGKRPKFAISEVNKRILDVFHQKRWISKYEIEEEFYRAIGRRSELKN